MRTYVRCPRSASRSPNTTPTGRGSFLASISMTVELEARRRLLLVGSRAVAGAPVVHPAGAVAAEPWASCALTLELHRGGPLPKMSAGASPPTGRRPGLPSGAPGTLSTCSVNSPDARTVSSGCARRGGATTAGRRSSHVAMEAVVGASCADRSPSRAGCDDSARAASSTTVTEVLLRR